MRRCGRLFDKQKQFIADASHELKTPLTIINTNADVLLANSEDTIRNQAKMAAVYQVRNGAYDAADRRSAVPDGDG
ncbi:histidine kinase dimerization/phospho-acceptor domain-containing protein [Paenibacillus rhizoplanae]